MNWNWKSFGLTAVIVAVFSLVGAVGLNGRSRLTGEWSIERGFKTTFGLLGGIGEILLALFVIAVGVAVVWALFYSSLARGIKVAIGVTAFVAALALRDQFFGALLPGNGGVVAALTIGFVVIQAAILTLVRK